MKLIFAIVHDADAENVTDAINLAEYSATTLCSTGGFLRSGNTTLLIGVEDEQVDLVIDIIEKNSKNRIEIAPAGRFYFPASKEIEVGGATVFVTKVELFKKV